MTIHFELWFDMFAEGYVVNRWKSTNTSDQFTHNNSICLIQGSYVFFNSYHPSAAYMRQLTGSALVQILARRLFGAKLLTEQMLT